VSRWHDASSGERHLLSLLRGHRMKRLLSRMLDERAFLSDFGVRSLGKFYGENPYVLEVVTGTFRETRIRACSAAIRIGAAQSGCR